MGDQGLIDKSMRSVFVGNIPYEATEEKLKDIFNEAGPVLSFKLVYDRETGKPKGYGFCEYKDTETALSAMRNLNGFEIGGRTLRVDNACTEKSRLEMQSLQQMTPTESPYGDPVSSDKAPEAICRAVASLPPEQMYELMRQMKECVQNNPAEARTMLLQNPQLSYALLQGLVVMRAVDPNVAVAMLHKSNPMPTPIFPSDKPMTVPLQTPVTTPASQPTTTIAQPPASTVRVGGHTEFQAGLREEGWVTAPAPVPQPVPPIIAPVGAKLPDPAMGPVGVSRVPPFMGGQDMDMRTTVDPRLSRILGDQDLRIAPAAVPLPVPVPVPVPVPQPASRNIAMNPPRDPRESFGQPDHFTARDPRATIQERFPSRDPRDRVDPRTGSAPIPVPGPRPQVAVPPSAPGSMTPGQASGLGGNLATGAASDHEKTALIMQVLQLSDEQIAMLPPEQRQSILVLKEQIAKSVQR